MGEVLDGCSGIATLHDRRIPGSKANINHLAVGPAGVFVIDAKRYKGRVEKRDVGGWLRHDERLYIAGRDRTALIESLTRQVSVVQDVLGRSSAPPRVYGVLCFAGAEWQLLFKRPCESAPPPCCRPRL